MFLLRCIAFGIFVILSMCAGYFFALNIFWLWVMSLFAGSGFLLFAIGMQDAVQEEEEYNANTR